MKTCGPHPDNEKQLQDAALELLPNDSRNPIKRGVYNTSRTHWLSPSVSLAQYPAKLPCFSGAAC